MAAPDYLTQHAGLVHLHAKRFSWACGGCIDYDDLVQAGNIGLVYAAEHFDASRGVKFSSFASLCIRTKIKDEVEYQSRTVNLPVSYRRKMWKEGKDINPHGISLDSGYEGKRSPIDRMTVEDNDPLEQAEARGRLEAVNRALKHVITGRTRSIMTSVYVDGRTIADTARSHSLSRERVRQLCSEGIRAIRAEVGQ